MTSPYRRVDRFLASVVRRLFFVGLCALVEFQGEAIHKFGGLFKGEHPGIQVTLEKRPCVLVESAKGVIILCRMEDHMKEPDRLECLPE